MFRHRAKNGVEDLKKAAWYLDHATCDELRPRADRHDMTDFGYRCGLVFSKAMAGDERDLDSLGATVWRRMPLFVVGCGGIVGYRQQSAHAFHDSFGVHRSPFLRSMVFLEGGA